MTQAQLDAELTLMVKPHHSYSYVIQAFSGEDESGDYTVLLKQLGFTTFADMCAGIDPEKDHEAKRQSIEWLHGLLENTRNMTIPVVAESPACGLGGVEYRLRIDPGEGASVEFEWWKMLPDHWKELQPIVDALLKEFG